MTFQLLVSGNGWEKSSDSIATERVFEHTDQDLAAKFNVKTREGRARLVSTPALLMPEGTSGDFAKVTNIQRVRVEGAQVLINYASDPELSPIPLSKIWGLRSELQIDKWEFSRTHWAIKDVDLFRTLLGCEWKPLLLPKVFKIDQIEQESDLVAVMMPFEASLDPVFKSIKAASSVAGYKCKRADDIWEDSILIQDIVTLISRASVVVCDCTARNANVFYETGIAHALGREVVIITQAKSDIPFDLQHHRFISYLNNKEGRAALEQKLAKRLETLANKAN